MEYEPLFHKNNKEIKVPDSNLDPVQHAVADALMRRDVDDLKQGQHELATEVNELKEELKNLATTEDIKKIQEQLDRLMPWAQTLTSLERLSKWLAAVAAGVAVLVAALSWIRGPTSGG